MFLGIMGITNNCFYRLRVITSDIFNLPYIETWTFLKIAGKFWKFQNKRNLRSDRMNIIIKNKNMLLVDVSLIKEITDGEIEKYIE